jgi:hypothetical protein
MRMHDYIPDPQSGAGNCGVEINGKTCGASQRHMRHPHEFMLPAFHGTTLCVCTLPYWAECHSPTRATS